MSSLENSLTVSTIEGEEKEQFLRFTSRMLEWLPEKRATAQELLDDPWMRSPGLKRTRPTVKLGLAKQ